jgi:hypothetical protein
MEPERQKGCHQRVPEQVVRQKGCHQGPERVIQKGYHRGPEPE